MTEARDWSIRTEHATIPNLTEAECRERYAQLTAQVQFRFPGKAVEGKPMPVEVIGPDGVVRDWPVRRTSVSISG